MKNRKRLMAVLLAAALATTSMTALADGTQKSTGTSTVENDNSELPKPGVIDVLLPTINSGTYDFTIDQGQLLEEYDDENSYDSNSYVYFNTVSTPAAIVPANNHYYVTDYTEVDATHQGASFKNAIIHASTGMTDLMKEEDLAKNLATAEASIQYSAGGYYVWAPKADVDTGEGEFVKITSENVKKLFDVVYNAEGYIDTTKTVLKTKNNKTEETNGNSNNGFLFDGKIYQCDFVEQTDGNKLAEYITYDADKKGKDAFVAIKDGLYVTVGAVKSATATPVALKLASAESLFVTGTSLSTYKKAETKKIDQSESAKIENKTAYPLAITAKVELVSCDGLNVTSSALATSSATPATIRVGIGTVSGTSLENVEYLSGTSTASGQVSYVLKSKYDTNSDGVVEITSKSGLELNKYQSSAKVATTGSHKYFNYVTANVGEHTTATCPSVSFAIKAEINHGEGSEEGWKKYVDSLVADGATKVKPTVNVIYHIDAVEQSKDNTSLYTCSGASIKYLVSGSVINNVATSDGLTISADEAVAATVKANVVKTVNGKLFVRLVEGQEAIANKVTSLKVNGATKSVVVEGGVLKLADQTYSDSVSYSVEVVYDGVTYVGKSK